MALTSDHTITRKEGGVSAAPVAAAATIHHGALVNLNASGYAKPASDGAGEKFAGLARARADNASGANGALNVELFTSAVALMAAAGMTQADAGEEAYVVDDATVGRGIAAQPVNVTGVALTRIAATRGGAYTLAFTATGTLLAYGGGTGVNVGAGGTFTLNAADGSQILATVTAGSLPGQDKSDNLTLRRVRAGVIEEVVSATQVYVDLAGAARR